MQLARPHPDSGHAPAAAAGRRRDAFTLVELLVVLVIIGILASLTLAGLAGVRQRARIEKTKSTIRKIDAVIQPMYESYLTRRVPVSAASPKAAAMTRLQNIRTLMAAEMPDNWADATVSLASTPWALTPGPNRYRRMAQSIGGHANLTTYQGSECLFMIVALGGFDPWAIENFRSDEIGDIDGDGAKEFWDGWGRPIGFIRWPVGFASIAQPQDPGANPDPFDPQKLSAPGNPPDLTQADFGLVPLLFSPGPDEATNDPLNTQTSGYGLTPGQAVIGKSLLSLRTAMEFLPGSLSDSSDAATAVRDNITNHDLLKK
jgi:prepilin-type N-terminal cleavage/methylation domain-containing protein